MRRLVWSCGLACGVAVAQVSVRPASMPKLGTVDVRFQSYNVEMVEVIGGRFWKPYGSVAVVAPAPAPGATPGGIDPALFEQRKPIDLGDARLRMLAKALGPTYMRVSGTWANTVYFQDTDGAAMATPPDGFGGVLTRAEWKGVVDFARATDARIVTSFAVSAGTRDAKGLWRPDQAKKFLAYNRSIDGPIAAAEFINEPTFASAAGVPKDYDGAAYGRDFQVFQRTFRKEAPGALLLGPGSVGEGIDLVPIKLIPSKEMLAASGSDPVDVFSYHFYGTVSSRCSGMMKDLGTTVDAALTPEWLDRTDTVEAFYAGLRDEYAPGKPIWLTETGQTACGGDRWASTFADTFRYVNQMGTLARRGVQVVMHNTLAASDYALIDEKTLTPRPNYWAALLWHQTMGTTVLDAGGSGNAALRIYAGCMKAAPGGVTMIALNLAGEPATLTVPQKAMRYTLTSSELAGRDAALNGKVLGLTAAGALPEMAGLDERKGKMQLPGRSITFLTDAQAGNPACR